MNSRRLFNVFEGYTGGVPHITSAKFVKMMKDASLLDPSFQQSDVDIIFTKCKTKGQRTVQYDGFKKALELIAAKKEVASNDLAEFVILKCGEGPSLTGVTQAKENRFYDDKSSYTGVHKAGGPTMVDKEKLQLHQLLDRAPADVRGLKKTMKESYHRDVTSPANQSTPGRHTALHSSRGTAHQNLPPAPPASHSRGQQHPPPLDQNVTPPPVPSQHLHYDQQETPAHQPQPQPTYLPHEHSSLLHHHTSPLMDQNALLGSLEKRLQNTSLGSSGATSRLNTSDYAYQQQGQPQHYPQQQQQQQQHQRGPPVDREQELYKIYKSFCTNQETAELDSTKFVKLCKDVGFIGPGNHLSTTDADLIFQKTKRSGNYGKKICYEDFRMVAIPDMAKRMRCQPDDVIAHIVLAEGPSLNNVTVAADVRFHDDVSTYTGVKGQSGGVNPSFAIHKQTIPMENILDRSEADYRGVKKAATQHPGHGHGHAHGHGGEHTVMAGEANKKGGIFDRLTNENSYTGVHRDRLHYPDTHAGEDHYDLSKLVQRR